MTRLHAGGGRCSLHEAGTIELYFYDELSVDERTVVEQHLPHCPRCREALQELGEIRDALGSRPVISAPRSGDWSAFMARLDRAIADPLVVPTARLTPSRTYVGYLAMAALLALVTISVLVAARWRSAPAASSTDARVETPSVALPAAGSPTAVAAQPEDVTALASVSEEHFERSKLVVLGLAAKDPGTMSADDWAYERQLASRLLGDTRLYRMAAEDRGMHNVAGVMRDLELVLLEASMADQSDPSTLAQLQRLIRKRDLVQKMNMVSSGL